MVIDGTTGNGPVLGKFCGSGQPPTTKSLDSAMTVRFRSDPAASAVGFKATYSIGWRFDNPAMLRKRDNLKSTFVSVTSQPV